MFYLFLAKTLMHQVTPLPEGAPKPWFRDGILDGWRLIRCIGAGGGGEVFLAENPQGERRALKVFAPTVEDRRAFDSEYAGMGWAKRLRGHPNLVPVTSAGRTEHCVYYTMPLADALGDDSCYVPHTLFHRIKRNDLGEAELLDIAGSVLSALTFLHRHDLVYRDVKPDNIMCVGGVWCLGDPGLISQSRPGLFAGTPGFYPKRRNFRAETSDDIYALGKTLYCAAVAGMGPECYPMVPDNYDYSRYAALRPIYRAAVEGEYRTALEMKKDVVAAQKELH